MDRNFALAVALSFVVLFAWSLVTQGNRPPQPPPAAETQAPQALGTPVTPAPEARVPPSPGTLAPAPPPRALEPEEPESRVQLRTALYDVELTSRGGALVRWELLAFEDASQPGRPPVELTTLAPGQVALATPFEEIGFGDLSYADYRVEQPDRHTVVFRRDHAGVRITKTYQFEEDAYLLRLLIQVENGTDRHLQPTFRVAWPAVGRDGDDFKEFQLAAFSEGDLEQAPVTPGPSFLGMGGGSFDEVIQHPPQLDWAGAQTRYFLMALLPDVPRQAAARFTPVVPGESALAEVAFSAIDLPPGQKAEHAYRVYLGPKETDRLDAVGAHLDEAILKGWFPSLTRFFTWLLTATYNVIPNYGVAIILITVLVRLLMAPVMARQMKSMKRMGQLQPKLKAIQEKHADDRQKQSEAMMAMYREEGVSPFAMMTGCLPMLLQLPVFIGFYYALQGAIQLRQQPFVAWIDDLSAPESLFVIPGLELPVRVLPLLMGGSMVVQQKLAPMGAMDPAQARMMMTMMPVMFTLLFYQFASGLVLYWLVSNLLGIGQQYLTNRSKD